MNRSMRMPLLAAAILALSAAPSAAAVIKDLGVIKQTGSTGYNANVAPGAFQDYILFSVAPSNNDDLAVSISNTYTNHTTGQSIVGLMLALYSGTYNGSQPNGGGTQLATAPTSPLPRNNTGELDYTLTSPGDYYIQISANVGSSDPASYGGSISYFVQTVPLPSSLPMLSGALLAVAAGSVVVSRRRSSQAVSL